MITTHSFGDIATATRIESIENARLINSTRTTVAQKGDSPSHALAAGTWRRSSVPSPPRKCVYVR